MEWWGVDVVACTWDDSYPVNLWLMMEPMIGDIPTTNILYYFSDL